MERESFIFYASFYQAIKEIPNENQLKVYQAITNFALTGTEPTDLNGIEKAVFILVKPQIIANNKRYENGCGGGRPKKEEKKNKKTNGFKNKKPNNNQSITKPKPNVNENVNENENENVNENVNENGNGNEKDFKGKVAKPPRQPKFQKPTKEELTDFATTEQLRTDIIAEFLDYYDSTGWKLSNGLPMKDWQATYKRWCRNQYEKPKNKSSGNEFLDMLKKEYPEEVGNIFPNAVDTEGVEE